MKVDSGLGLTGKVAIVTGGSRGIGRATVECLARAGVQTVVNYLHNEAAAVEVTRKAEELGVKSMAWRADVRDLTDAERLVAETVEQFGSIDLLVCNAGIWEGKNVEEITEDLWNKVIDINLKGTWTMCRAAVPFMKRQKFGRIVIVSSTAGQRGEATVSNYAASKGGQISFAKSLAVELAGFNITVNAVAPGWVDTEMNTDAFAASDLRQQIEESIPLKRIATAEDIAQPIVFLCSEWARHITGEVLNINGGAVLCG